MSEGEYVDSLVNEYTSLFHGKMINESDAQHDAAGIVEELVVSADWSASAAQELIRLAEHYGAFMLRNALAVAVVLGKEDGSLGF
jgi:hypothetical protein